MRSSMLLLLAAATASPATALPADAWQRDLQALRTAYAETHPEPWHKLSRQEFDRMADALAADLAKLDDSQAIARMIELIAATGEGHTRLTLPLAEGAGVFLGHAKTETPKVPAFLTLPIRFEVASDGYVVRAASPAHKALVGAALVAIDDKPLAAVEQAMLPLVNGDNTGMKRAYLPSYLMVPELLRARSVAASAQPRFRFRLANGREIERQLAALPAGADLSWAAVPEAPPFSVQTLGDGVIHARVREITNTPDKSLAQFAAEVFAAVDAAPDARLAIDLRGNPGGNNFLIDPIVRGAASRPQLWKPGRLFVLTDAETFSAAQNLVNALERWTPAVIVGGPTGSAPSTYGDSKRVVLPESGLTLRVSSLYWQDTGPMDKRETTMPHVPAPRTVADLRSGRDPALDAIAQLTKVAGPATGRWSARFSYGYRPATLDLDLAYGGGSFAVPELKLKETRFDRVAADGGQVSADGRIGTARIALRAEATVGGLIGWLDVNGRPYPFVAQRRK